MMVLIMPLPSLLLPCHAMQAAPTPLFAPSPAKPSMLSGGALPKAHIWGWWQLIFVCINAFKGSLYVLICGRASSADTVMSTTLPPWPLDHAATRSILQDRLIRLVIPVMVFAVLIFPLLLTVNVAAGIPPDNPHPWAYLGTLSYSELWATWFSKMFMIAPGPTW